MLPAYKLFYNKWGSCIWRLNYVEFDKAMRDAYSIQQNLSKVTLFILYRFIEQGTYICNVQLKSSKKAGSNNSLVFSSLSRKNNIKVFVSYRASSKTQTDQSHLPT